MNPKNQTAKPLSNSEEHEDALAYSFLKKLGYLLPDSEEEFLKLDNELRKNPISLPLSLSDPMRLIDCKYEKIFSNKHIENTNIEKTTEMNLAQAARDGKTITESVKIKMKMDKGRSLNKGN